ncbi:hypothetical protein HAX54_030755 [Datura stramonium]|uniref:Uncharacterized protein n=1 Tax=Datura stramonium TaxID=4076 RepID=A0ABS8V8T3_DATST|nr:hypothetical protein [Datura stramonium]
MFSDVLKGLQKCTFGLRKAATCSVSGILYLRCCRKVKQDTVWTVLQHVHIKWLDLIKQLLVQSLHHSEFHLLTELPLDLLKIAKKVYSLVEVDLSAWYNC